MNHLDQVSFSLGLVAVRARIYTGWGMAVGGGGGGGVRIMNPDKYENNLYPFFLHKTKKGHIRANMSPPLSQIKHIGKKFKMTVDFKKQQKMRIRPSLFLAQM